MLTEPSHPRPGQHLVIVDEEPVPSMSVLIEHSAVHGDPKPFRVYRVQAHVTQPRRLVPLPQETRQPSCVGTVLAVGPGLLTLDGSRAPMQVRVGDRVTFGVYAGEYVDPRDTGRREDMVLIMRESDVQFVVESESVAA